MVDLFDFSQPIEPPPPLTAETLQKAIDAIKEQANEPLDLRPQPWIMHPEDYRWFDEKTIEAGIRTSRGTFQPHHAAELWRVLAAEDQWFTWLASLGWREGLDTTKVLL